MPLDSVYVSYSWKVEEQNLVVDKLEQACRNRGIELKRDRNEIDYGDSIRAYMDRLAVGGGVILVLSDAYFKSSYCMYELREIYRNKNFREHVFPIVIKGTHFHKARKRIPYIQHWEKEKEALKGNLQTIHMEHMGKASHDELKDYDSFCQLIDDLQAVLADMNTLTEDVHVSTDFEALLDRIKPVIAPPGDEPDPPRHEKQKAFENKIRREIKKLLSKENLKSFAGVLLEVLRSKDREPNEIAPKNDVRSGRDPPDVEELIKKLWMPDDPLDMIDTLHKATSKCLQTLREGGADVSETHKVWQAATRILGYMAICLVSREWLDSHRAQSNPYHDIPLEKLAGIEIVSARLEEIPACLTLSGAEIHGTNWIFIREGDIKSPETFVPEQGWQVKQTCEQIEVMVYRAVLNEKKEKLTHIDRDDLNETLKIYREDPDDTKNYYLSVHKASRSHPLRDQEICASLNQRLHELPIIHFGAGEGQQPLLVSEGVLAARIRHFLKLIHNEP